MQAQNLQIRANWTYMSVDSRLMRALYWSTKETLHELYYETVIVWKGGRPYGSSTWILWLRAYCST